MNNVPSPSPGAFHSPASDDAAGKASEDLKARTSANVEERATDFILAIRDLDMGRICETRSLECISQISIRTLLCTT